jgi:dihydroflavonol-4-reductase
VLPRGARLVLTSSVVAVGGSRAREVLNEESPFTLDELKVGYVRAKRAAELEALAADRDVVVVNPGYLFGPDDPGPSVMGSFCRRFWRGHVPFAPPGGINCVDVRDVAAGHLLAAERGKAGRRYILGGVNLTFAELVVRLAEAARLRPRWLPRSPRALFTGLAVWNEGLSRLSGKEPFPSLEHVRMNRLFWFHSSARAAAELGYAARPFDDTLADAYAWHARQNRATPRGFGRWWLRPAA